MYSAAIETVLAFIHANGWKLIAAISDVAIVVITFIIGLASYSTNRREKRKREHGIKAERVEKLLSLSNHLIQNRDLLENIEYPISDPSNSYRCVVYFDFDPSHKSQPNEFSRYGFAMIQSVKDPNSILSFEFTGHSQVKSTSIEIVQEPKFDLESDTWDKLHYALKNALNYAIKSELSFRKLVLSGKDIDEVSDEAKSFGIKRGHAGMNTKSDRKIVNAILNINVDKVRRKIDKVSHIDARDSSGRTFLHYAVSIAYSRLKNDYEHVLNDSISDIQDSKYLTNLMNDLDEIISILANKGANINARDNRGDPVIYAAAESGNHRAIDILLVEGAEVNILSKYDRNTALHIAVYWGWSAIVEKLIRSGCDLHHKNSKGKTPLHYVFYSDPDDAIVQSEKLKIVEMLIENGANVNEKDNIGETPLHSALYSGPTSAIKILINSGAGVNEVTSERQTPLHKASYLGSLPEIEILIEKQAKVNAVDAKGETPLHKASYGGHLQAIEILVKNHAEINSINSRGKTPLHVALRNVDFDQALPIVRFLVDNGASISFKDRAFLEWTKMVRVIIGRFNS